MDIKSSGINYFSEQHDNTGDFMDLSSSSQGDSGLGLEGSTAVSEGNRVELNNGQTMPESGSESNIVGLDTNQRIPEDNMKTLRTIIDHNKRLHVPSQGSASSTLPQTEFESKPYIENKPLPKSQSDPTSLGS